MDVHEDAIGVWPNVALNPGTRTHAATGEPVAQPEWTRIGWQPMVRISYPVVTLGPDEVEAMKTALERGVLEAGRKVVDK